MAALGASFKRRLDELACPYVDSVSEDWIKELIFKPGEPRIRLLQWLFTKFDPELRSIVDSQFDRSEHRTDSRIQRLTFVASILGLCRSDDYDLIRGVGVTESRQTEFMNRLIDLVCIAQDMELSASAARGSSSLLTTTTTTTMPFEPTSLECAREEMLRARHLINTIANRVDVTEALTSSCQLFPPDMMQICRDRLDETVMSSSTSREKSRSQKVKPPGGEKLSLQAKELSEKLDSLRNQVETLEEETVSSATDQTRQRGVDKIGRGLAVSLSTLSQLVGSFCHTYDAEMEPWTKKRSPTLSEIGPTSKRIKKCMKELNALFDDLSTARKAHESLSRPMKRSHKKGTNQLAYQLFEDAARQ